jgi:hypothetical protein
MAKHIDLTNKKFGRWLVLKYIGNSNWLCQCECGTTSKVRTSELKNGNSRSCGCLHKEIVSKTSKKNRVYKKEYNRLRQIFGNMKQRCYDKNSINFKNYGAKGIKICNEWLENPLSFCEWAINNGYTNTLTIDRINVNQNYTPDNCRWVSQKIQQNNRTNNHLIVYKGIIHSMSEWSDILKINYNTLKSRIRYGWSLERMFNDISTDKT